MKRVLEESSRKEFLERVLEESSLTELFNRVLEVLEEFSKKVLNESS